MVWIKKRFLLFSVWAAKEGKGTQEETRGSDTGRNQRADCSGKLHSHFIILNPNNEIVRKIAETKMTKFSSVLSNQI